MRNRLSNAKKNTKIYIIEMLAPINNYRIIKIGSSRSILNRINDLKVGSPWDLKILFHSDWTYIYIEKELHQIFKEFNLKGEWFQFPKNIDFISKVKEICNGDTCAENWIDLQKLRRKENTLKKKIKYCIDNNSKSYVSNHGTVTKLTDLNKDLEIISKDIKNFNLSKHSNNEILSEIKNNKPNLSHSKNKKEKLELMLKYCIDNNKLFYDYGNQKEISRFVIEDKLKKIKNNNNE